jgi:trimeric autotransporter adhesin
LKKDIVDAESVLDKVMNVQVRRFKFKEGSTNDEYNEIGVIAQELEDVFPDLVSTFKDPQSEEDYLAVGYTSFGIISVKAVQELKKEKDAEIQTLRSEIDELKAQINELKALIQN